MSDATSAFLAGTRSLTASELTSLSLDPRPPSPPPAPISTLRATHHRMAQLDAMDTPIVTIARLCGTSTDRVRQLRDDPAYRELLAHYRKEDSEEWADIQRLMADLSGDFLGKLRELLETQPDRFSPSTILEAVKVLADRTGHAPISRSVSVNVNSEAGDRLSEARARRIAAEREAAAIDGEFTVA